MDNGGLSILMKTVVLVSLVVRSWGWPGPQAPHLDVETTQGTARGYLAPNPPHYAFLGIPYARPPTDSDRFKAPTPPARWDGVFEAGHVVRCAQAQRRGAHGCQVVNVFAPKGAHALPVLVHVHNGGFAAGWGAHDPPSRLLALNFIIVTFNYRIGAEGFLCLGTKDVPGNAGLKDQVAALYWVHRNIDKFGGSPYKVTLYGSGAGAASAELLYLSGATQGLVQKIILESGSAISPTSLGYNYFSTALNLAGSLGYEGAENQTLEDLSTFFQELPASSLLNISDKFMPCLESDPDSYILRNDPIQLLYNGSIERVPLLITYSKEVIIKSNLNQDAAEIFRTLPDDFEEMLPNNLEFDSDELRNKIGEQMRDLYFKELISEGNVAECYENYMNDVFSVYPIVKSATMHAASSHQPVFLMEYSALEGNQAILEHIFDKGEESSEDQLISEKFVTLWSNFMKYSDPTPIATSILPLVWQPLTFPIRNGKPDVSKAVCLIFESGSPLRMGQPSSSYALAIWDHLYNGFYKFHTPVPDYVE